MVLFIPGFMQRGDAWRPVAELLPERYPSTMLDHSEHSFEGRFARSQHSGAEVLVGYSLGGRLALRAALRSAESLQRRRARGLDGRHRRGPAASRAGRGGREAGLLDGGDADRGHCGRSGSASRCSPTSLTRSSRSSAPAGSRRTRARSRCCSAPRARESSSRCGTSCVLWSYRCWRSPGRATMATRARPSASRRPRRTAASAIVEEAGHAPQLQRPDEVARLISEFLDAALRR